MNKIRFALPCVLALLLVATITAPATAASTQSTATQTHPIEYQIGCGQAMIWDGSLEYFKEHGFSTCLLYTSPSPRDRQKSRMPYETGRNLVCRLLLEKK